MKSSLTGFDIFNTVMLQRSLDKRLVVLVESPEDSGVIDPHLNASVLQTFPGYGKESVLTAAQMFLSHQISEVIAIVDADLDRYNGRQQRHPPNVAITEFYDLDADVLFHCPQALDAIVVNFTDKDRRQSYLESRDISAREAIWEMAIAVGEVRYYSVIRQCELHLRGFPLHEVIVEYERGAVQSSVLALALARTPSAPEITASAVAMEVAALPDKQYVASGHDLISALAALVRMRWGGTAGEKLLAPALRSAVQCHCWKKTVVYRFIREWASQFNATSCGPDRPCVLVSRASRSASSPSRPARNTGRGASRTGWLATSGRRWASYVPMAVPPRSAPTEPGARFHPPGAATGSPDPAG